MKDPLLENSSVFLLHRGEEIGEERENIFSENDPI